MIQPFDGGPYDRRFKDVLAPAITDAGLEPYRVDQDPSVQVPIEDIEDGIRRAEAVLADVSEDNPNVWYELGYAFAHQRVVVLVCSKGRREKFPFDIQHRHIIRYGTDSPSDFDQFRKDIASRLRAAIDKQHKLGMGLSVAPVAEVEGLAQHELALLATVAQSMYSSDGHASVYAVRQDMQRAGFNDLAVTLASTVLQRKGLIGTADGYDGHNEYDAYVATQAGLDWLLANVKQLDLKARAPQKAPWDDAPF